MEFQQKILIFVLIPLIFGLIGTTFTTTWAIYQFNEINNNYLQDWAQRLDDQQLNNQDIIIQSQIKQQRILQNKIETDQKFVFNKQNLQDFQINQNKKFRIKQNQGLKINQAQQNYGQITSVQNNIYYQISILSGLSVILWVFSYCQVKSFSKTIVQPLDDLEDKVTKLEQEDYEVNLMENYEDFKDISSQEVNKLYACFNNIKQKLHFYKSVDKELNNAQQLIQLSSCLNFFIRENQMQGQGICYNNIGNIHMKENRIKEAIISYRYAVAIGKKQLEEALGIQQISDFYKYDTVDKSFLQKQVINIKSEQSKNSNTNLNNIPTNKIHKPRKSILNNININLNFMRKISKPSKEQQLQNQTPQEKKVSKQLIQNLETVYANRNMQLSNALVLQGFKEEDPIIVEVIWKEVIDINNMLLSMDKLYKLPQVYKIRTILQLIRALIERAKCQSKNYLNKPKLDKQQSLRSKKQSFSINYEEENNKNVQKKKLLNLKFEEISKQIEKAEEEIIKYKDFFQKLDKEEQKFYIEPTIFLDRALFLQGMIQKEMGSQKDACYAFLQCIFQGRVYEPLIRRECLENIIEIFTEQDLIEQCPQLNEMMKEFTQKFKHKDIIICLDSSKHMQTTNQQYLNDSVNKILNIFDNYIDNEDRIAMMTYNIRTNIMFELQDKKLNSQFLQQNIQNLKDQLVLEDECDILHSIVICMQMYKQVQQTQNENEKYIVTFVSGNIYDSKISYTKVIKMIKQLEISLVVICLNLQQNSKYRNILISLCEESKNGVFIEDINSPYIEKIFQSISKQYNMIQYSNQLNSLIQESYN